MSALLLAAADNTIDAPSVSYSALSPILIVLGAAILGVIAEAVLPRRDRFPAQLVISLGGLIAAVVAVGVIHATNVATPSPAGSNLSFAGSLAVDSTGLFIQGTVLALAIMATLLMAERSVDVGSPIVASSAVVVGSADDRRLAQTDRVQTEIFPLMMFAVSGMLIFPIANNLLLMFVALEVLSLPLYLMAGMARRRRLLSQEAAVKYFLLGAFASAFFLYGLALLYGYANSVDLPTILQATRGSTKSDILLYAGLALLLVGLLFKAGIAPFHSWTPDVYQGSPTPVTAFMAACTKVAAFGAIIRVLYVGFNTTAYDWRPIIWAAAIASMVVGAVFGLTQTDVKRILAYSSIAHAGFILVGLLAVDRNGHLGKDGISSVLFYVLTYGFSTLAAFGLLMVVRDSEGEATRLAQWSGLAKKSPAVAITMTVLLMSMAGIPLTSGFTGKFFVFRAAFSDAGPLVVIALISSAIAAFFYLRIVVLMFFADPPENAPTIAIPGWSTSIALTFGVVVTVVLGVFPQPILDLATKAARLTG
ncbi:NADH-quinone oxidoreductase subunit N [Jatrophihabitans endophyticus]|uniref:NADH-quinone oxidoreductase subunit N n=1 Tax=Jatrophihabitans endophyticus TaxID=1206085 RepID=A0A1M5GV63_9ACTN|nr:NADH-quinone oxidoreductase subunit NuoN [Jatrophihabitans endophyticus]SHG07583.1 NADH-quinone oxidoreductase subunit N [Jatrophihabitans endophyticus]